MTGEEHPGATDADGSPGAGSSAKGCGPGAEHHLWRMTAIWLVLASGRWTALLVPGRTARAAR